MHTHESSTLPLYEDPPFRGTLTNAPKRRADYMGGAGAVLEQRVATLE